MRFVVIGLLAAAGCNQIWGLGPVDLDEGSGSGAGPRRVRITTQITKTTPDGAADPVLDYLPVAPAPMVQIGPLGGPLEERPYAADGTVTYCDEAACVAPARTPWRMVYTLADGLPREVQWAPDTDLAGHLTEPQFGRLERLPVPAGGGYSITPTNSSGPHALTRVFTTGLWTEGAFTSTIFSATVDYDFSTKARSLSGPLGAPEPARGDYAVLADFKNGPAGCRASSGVAAFRVPEMVAGMRSPPMPQPDYVSADKQLILNLGGPRPVDFRLGGLLGTRSGTPNTLHMELGYMPSTGVFGFSKPAPSPILDFYLPGPQLIAFATCAFASGPSFKTDAFADPLDLRDRFPPIVHVEATNQRTRGAVSLTSGFSAVLVAPGTEVTSDFAVAAPVRIRLARPDGAPIADLEDIAAEPTPLPPLGPMDLVFDVEPDPVLAADSFEITLHAITATGKLERQRIFTVADRKLALDPAIFRPATEYVFEVRAFRGRPNAATGDFATNAYPQYAAAIFTRTFKTP